jgi:type IV secretion system protein VirB2
MMRKMMMRKMMKKANRYVTDQNVQKVVLVGLLMALGMQDAMAATGGLPWEGPLEQVVHSLCGPVAKGAAVIAFVVTGLMVAFGEAKGMFGTMLRIAFGLSLALMAVQWLGFFTTSSMSCN